MEQIKRDWSGSGPAGVHSNLMKKVEEQSSSLMSQTGTYEAAKGASN